MGRKDDRVRGKLSAAEKVFGAVEPCRRLKPAGLIGQVGQHQQRTVSVRAQIGQDLGRSDIQRMGRPADALAIQA